MVWRPLPLPQPECRGRSGQGERCHLVDAQRIDSLAEGIESMLTNTDLQRQLAGEAAEQSFQTWEGYFEGWKQRL